MTRLIRIDYFQQKKVWWKAVFEKVKKSYLSIGYIQQEKVWSNEKSL